MLTLINVMSVVIHLMPRVTYGLGAPLLPLTYIIVNLIFNVSGLYLIRTIGTVGLGLSASFIVPVTVAVFSLPLPYLVS